MLNNFQKGHQAMDESFWNECVLAFLEQDKKI